MFNTISARQIQREYKKVLQEANESAEPIVVMANNKPLGAVIGLDLLEKIQLELIVKQALKESKSRKTKVIETSRDLQEDLKELEKYAASKT
jgi:prevent-host-death family protein